MVENGIFNKCLERGMEEEFKDYRQRFLNDFKCQLQILCDKKVSEKQLIKELFEFVDNQIAERYYGRY